MFRQTFFKCFLVAFFALLLFGCAKKKSKEPTEQPTLNCDSKFGLAVGNVRKALYPTDGDSLTITCEATKNIGGKDVYIVDIYASPMPGRSFDPQKQHKLYLATDSDGLKWYGGYYCNTYEIIFPVPRLICPCNLDIGLSWGTNTSSKTKIWRCRETTVGRDNAKVVSKETVEHHDGGDPYVGCYKVRYEIPDIGGYGGSLYAEMWFSLNGLGTDKGLGPVKMTCYRDSTFTGEAEDLIELLSWDFPD